VARRREIAVERAVRTLRSHPHIDSVAPRRDVDGETAVDIIVRVNLPSRCAAEGRTPRGLLAAEPVTVLFPATYPRRAPRFYARSDFDRGLAHIQPGPPIGPVQPCISEANATELLHQGGLLLLVEHLVEWFDKAAGDSLIDPDQGWEPVRRDTLDDTVIADFDHFRALVKPNSGFAFLRFEYLLTSHRYIGEVSAKVFPTLDIAGATGERPWNEIRHGRGPAIIVWPGNDASGKPFLADKYYPETVVDLWTLKERAKLYGCNAALESGLASLFQFLGKQRRAFAAAIILCARRPFHLIGSESCIEVSPYIVTVEVPGMFPSGDSTPVRPASHRHAITPELLREMSGGDVNFAPPAVTLLGCGSLGSKIALHLTRRGAAPSAVVDQSSLSPHNAARHALIPSAATQFLWWASKSAALGEAIGGFAQATRVVDGDITDAAADANAFARMIGRKTPYVLNTTATLTVAESLAGARAPQVRVLDAAVMHGGAIGTFAMEGERRNPDIGDLMSETYRRLSTVELAGSAAAPASIGEGCSSVTMTMSDARVSMFAAPMSELVVKFTKAPTPGGVLMVGRVGDDDVSLTWDRVEVHPVSIIRLDGTSSVARVAAHVTQQIEAEVARWPKVETGGVLMGRFSEVADAFYVTDVLEAPPDSSRSAWEFVLGTEGLATQINDYVSRRHGTLYCLGTWHSHLRTQGASGTDRNTATILAHARITPSLMLIHTSVGFRGIAATEVGTEVS
jgi:hypothetical protein